MNEKYSPAKDYSRVSFDSVGEIEAREKQDYKQKRRTEKLAVLAGIATLPMGIVPAVLYLSRQDHQEMRRLNHEQFEQAKEDLQNGEQNEYTLVHRSTGLHWMGTEKEKLLW